MSRRMLVVAGVLALGMAVCAAPAGGADTNWIGLSGNWSDANNWSAGEPNSPGSANISNGGTVMVSLPLESCGTLYVAFGSGQSGSVNMVSGVLVCATPSSPPNPLAEMVVGVGGTGTFFHTDGNNVVIGTLRVGYMPGSNGLYQLTGSGRLTARGENVGSAGAVGVFAQTGGENLLSSDPNPLFDTGTLRLTGDIADPGRYELGGSGRLRAYYQLIGSNGAGGFVHTDGNNIVTGWLCLGYQTGSSGTYRLSGGGRLWAISETIGWAGGTGLFVQSCGQHIVGDLQIGAGARYEMNGGSLQVTTRLRSSGTLDIAGEGGVIAISGLLSIESQGSMSSLPGSVIHMTGSEFRNASTDANALAGLNSLTMIFEGGDANVDPFEVAGRDIGADGNGFVGNFGLGALELGGAAGVGRVVLVDLFDNQPASSGKEALYVQGLVVNPGSELCLNGIHLYVSGVLVSEGDGALYGGGEIYAGAVPEPGAIFLLAVGGLALLRSRRRGRGDATLFPPRK